jgi:enoyl-CoA hydratase/carnithine racemase
MRYSRGRALWITFDRPEKLNILHPEDLSELRDAITGLASGVPAICRTWPVPQAT